MGSQDEITVFAPSTVANIGCGYDILGLALEAYGDTLHLRKRDDNQLVIKEIIGATGLPMGVDQNVATVALSAFLEDLGSEQGFDLRITKNIAPGSGLGSSASSSVAAVFAANELLGKPKSKRELVTYTMQGEKAASGAAHADNVAPSMLGGVTVVRGYDPLDVFGIPFPDDLKVVIVFPQVSIKTSDAKRILKKQIDLKDAITQWGNVAGLVSGMILKDHSLIGRSLQDVVVEPVRSLLIPRYDEVKAYCLSKGALGFNISGSGPSMFALTNDDTLAQELSISIPKLYEKEGIDVISFVSAINPKGAEIIESSNHEVL